MKEREKVNWGLLLFIGIFCFCLTLGMELDLKGQNYPNNLNAYQEMYFPPSYGCGNDIFWNIGSATPVITNLEDGDIR